MDRMAKLEIVNSAFRPLVLGLWAFGAALALIWPA